jgi:hypothetical protein
MTNHKLIKIIEGEEFIIDADSDKSRLEKEKKTFEESKDGCKYKIKTEKVYM